MNVYPPIDLSNEGPLVNLSLDLHYSKMTKIIFVY